MQNRFGGEPVTATADPTFCSGSRAKVCDGTGGRRLLTPDQYATISAMIEQRTQALRARREMHADDRARASRNICHQITSSREFSSASLIACYLPMTDEVDTREIIERAWRANKRIFIPVIRNNRKMFFREIRPNTTLQQNRHSIWEPLTGDFVAPRKLQLVITPTVVFDHQNNRIGMGGGYYDECFKFLRHRKHWLRPKLIGVAFKCQEVEKISPNTWDVRLYRIIFDT